MKDLWNDVARRVRQANRVAEPEMPFGFSDAVLQKLRTARRGGSNLLDDWMAVLRPAVGLAFGTALVCVLLQYRFDLVEQQPTDAVAQTEALIRLAVLND